MVRPKFASPVPHDTRCSRGFDPAAKHYGVDFVVATGTAVSACGSGSIIRASEHPDFGLVVIVMHEKAEDAKYYYSLYAHLDKLHEDIKLGSDVDSGDTLGRSGNSGRSTGPHLHFEILVSKTKLTIQSTGPLGIKGSEYRADPCSFIHDLHSDCCGVSL